MPSILDEIMMTQRAPGYPYGIEGSYSDQLHKGAAPNLPRGIPADTAMDARGVGDTAREDRILDYIRSGSGKGYRGPAKKFRRKFDVLYPYFTRSLEPARMRSYEQAALGEQRDLRATDQDYSQAGLLNSGAYMQARQGVRGMRTAQENQALIDYYTAALEAAMGGAGRKGKGRTPSSEGGGMDWGGALMGLGTAALGGWASTGFAT
jgi:hypothetical protein